MSESERTQIWYINGIYLWTVICNDHLPKYISGYKKNIINNRIKKMILNSYDNCQSDQS